MCVGVSEGGGGVSDSQISKSVLLRIIVISALYGDIENNCYIRKPFVCLSGKCERPQLYVR